MKKGFLKGAGILALATFLSKIIGAFFRIPLTNVIGAEGMGVYQLIFPIYTFILSSSTGALPVAISIYVSEKLASDKKDEVYGVLNSSMSALLMTGIITSLALVILSGPIGMVQGSTKTQLGYVAIAPAVFLYRG
jgi:Polysaccharide biosynthesis protein.